MFPVLGREASDAYSPRVEATMIDLMDEANQRVHKATLSSLERLPAGALSVKAIPFLRQTR